MTVKELIIQLLDCPQDADVIISKELDFNIWLSTSNIKIKKPLFNSDIVLLDFDFSEKLLDRIRKS